MIGVTLKGVGSTNLFRKFGISSLYYICIYTFQEDTDQDFLDSYIQRLLTFF